MKILVAVEGITENHKTILKNAYPSGEYIYKSLSDITEYDIKDAEIIFGNPYKDMISKAINLKFLQLETAGADLYVKEGILNDNVILANATGSYGIAISEYMIGALLYMMKKFDNYRDAQKNHLWSDFGQVKSIYGSNVLILGLGDIGGEFAKRIHMMGGRTIGVRRKNTVKPDYIDELYLNEDIDKLIQEADVIAMSLPGTPETYHIIDEKRLRAMKKDALIINVGRGNAVDTQALAKVMKEGYIGGAFIDVTEIEPLPLDSQLWDIKNLFITPHVSGGHHLQETLNRIVNIAAENIRRYVNNEKIINLVDFNTGYRKL